MKYIINNQEINIPDNLIKEYEKVAQTKIPQQTIDTYYKMAIKSNSTKIEDYIVNAITDEIALLKDMPNVVQKIQNNSEQDKTATISRPVSYNFINDNIKLDFPVSKAIQNLIDKCEKADAEDNYGIYMNYAEMLSFVVAKEAYVQGSITHKQWEQIQMRYEL